jgi:hypothetical protein
MTDSDIPSETAFPSNGNNNNIYSQNISMHTFLHPHVPNDPSSHLIYVVVESTIFMFLGLMLGFFISFMVPNVAPKESIWQTVGWLIFQLLVDALFISILDTLYIDTFGRDADTFIGMSVFAVVFFMSQVQLYNRVSVLYRYITGTTLVKM